MAKEEPADPVSAAPDSDQSQVSSPVDRGASRQRRAPQQAGAPRRKPRSEQSSLPFVTMKVELKSFNAQKTMDRGFEMTSEALFTLSVLIRAITSEAEAVEVEGIVNATMSELAAELQAELARLQLLGEANGVTTECLNYSLPKSFVVKVTSPRASHLIKLLRDMDKIIEAVDALWLAQVVKDAERSKTIYDVQKKILRLSGVFRNLANRAMASSQRKGDLHVQDPRVGTKLDPDAAADSTASPTDVAGKTPAQRSAKARATAAAASVESTPAEASSQQDAIPAEAAEPIAA